MKKSSYRLTEIVFLVTLLVITMVSSCFVAYAETDTTPPQLTIWPQDFNTPDKEIIVYGKCADENGIQKVTVNGETATGLFSGTEFSWQKTVSLNAAGNIITVNAYDNSPSHNKATETFTVIYQPITYAGPTVEVIPASSQPVNNAVVQCIINPRGLTSYLHIFTSSSSYANAPFGWGHSIDTFSGAEDILVNFTIPHNYLTVGESVTYQFRISSVNGIDFAEVQTVQITEAVEITDTEPPSITISHLPDAYNTPNREIIVTGRAWDNSGVANVTVNGEPATGLHQDEWFFWQKPVNLTTGLNEIKILAYDDSPNHYVSQKTVEVTYQPSGYLGPLIDLALPSNITSNSISLNCVFNPNVRQYSATPPYTQVFLFYDDSSSEAAPFTNRELVAEHYSGAEDISLSYHFTSDTPERTISYMFYAWNSMGAAFSDVMTVTLKSGVVDFSVTPQPTYKDCQTVFDATGSFSPFGSVESYAWDFGDGNTTTTLSPTISHVYDAAGAFDVTLTMLDAFGQTNSTATNITVLSDNVAPTTTQGYDGLWHTSDFNVKLSAEDTESGVAETYYRINQGEEKTVSADGQPRITVEGADNTLEFWSVDNAGNIEAVQVVSGMKLDKTSPTIVDTDTQPENQIKEDQDVTVLVSVSDSVSGIENVVLSYSVDDGATWNDLPVTFNLALGVGEATIPSQPLWTNVLYRIVAYDNAGNSVSTESSLNYSYEVIPEFPPQTVLFLFVAVTLCALVVKKKLRRK